MAFHGSNFLYTSLSIIAVLTVVVNGRLLSRRWYSGVYQNVTWECSQPGPMCSSCNQVSICVLNEYDNGASSYQQLQVDTCEADEGCSHLTARCSKRVGECYGGIKFRCHNEGIFPDPYDCNVYYSCGAPPKSTDPVVEYDYDKQFFCPWGSAFNAGTEECDLADDDVCVRRPVPPCEELLQTGSLEANPNIYYSCVNVSGKGLQPKLFRCAANETFDADNFVCRNKQESTTISSTVVTGATTTSARASTLSSTSSTTTTPQPTTTITTTVPTTTTTTTTQPTTTTTQPTTTITTTSTEPTTTTTTTTTTTEPTTTTTEPTTTTTEPTTTTTEPTTTTTEPTTTTTEPTTTTTEPTTTTTEPTTTTTEPTTTTTEPTTTTTEPTTTTTTTTTEPTTTTTMTTTTTTVEPTTTTPGSTTIGVFHCTAAGIFPDPESCQKFYRCEAANSKPRHSTCYFGHFDISTAGCVFGGC